jgi:hypothetical protein
MNTPDLKLSDHFSLFELTATSNEALQSANRDLTTEQVQKLSTLALHAEAIREICGGIPLRVHSGYRAPALNGATLGSSSTSQHPKCEAIDFDVKDQTLDDTFRKLLEAGEAGTFRFGQLILEEADRGFKDAEGRECISRWIHCSVEGSLPREKIGQVMKMNAGTDGKPHYVLSKQIHFQEAT